MSSPSVSSGTVVSKPTTASESMSLRFSMGALRVLVGRNPFSPLGISEGGGTATATAAAPVALAATSART